MSNTTKNTTMKKDGKPALVPTLRFPEFRDAEGWEHKYIEDFFNVGSSKRVLQQDWVAQGIPFYRTRELVSLSKNESFSSEIFISKTLFEEITQKYGAPQEGDFLVSGVGTLGISYLVKKNDEFYFKDGNVLWFSRKGGVSSLFFKYCFESDVIQDQILKQASVSTVGTYTIQNAKITRFYCPQTEKEQQKIAECLSSADELIATQARKLDALKTHKRGLMQQLFPREGETQPRLRFPEFQNAGEWEVQPLGQLLVSNPDYGVNAAAVPFSEVLPKYLRITDISEDGAYLSNKMVSVDIEPTDGNYLDEGDIVLARTGASVGKSYRYRKEDGRLVFAGFLIRIKPAKNKLVSAYLANFLTTDVYWDWVAVTSTRSGQPGINSTEYSSLSIPLPPGDLSEQQRIADCLTSLDDLMTAEAQKLEALKAHKKGLMQQLFPSPVEAEA